MSKNIIAIVISLISGFVLMIFAMLLSGMFVFDAEPNITNTWPIFTVPFIAALISWLISKDKTLSVLIFIIFLVIAFLFGRF